MAQKEEQINSKCSLPKLENKLPICNGKKTIVHRNPLTEPISVSEFSEMGIHPHCIKAINHKFTEIKNKLPPELLPISLKKW